MYICQLDNKITKNERFITKIRKQGTRNSI